MIICLEDLIGNALIELWKNKGIKKVSASMITNYKNEILKRGKEKELNITFKSDFYDFTDKYFFTFEDSDGILYLLKDNISLDKLCKRYRAIISFESLLIISDYNVLKSIGVGNGK